MLKNNPWKFESNEKLSSKVTYGSNASSPSPSLPYKNGDNLSPNDRKDVQLFSLTVKTMENKKESSQQKDRKNSKIDNSIKLDDIHKKFKERQQIKMAKGLTVKMKSKLQEQLKNALKLQQDLQIQLNSLSKQITSLTQSLRLRKRLNQDVSNNQQMLLFKEKQYTNLLTIHSELLQGAKKDILHQRQIKQNLEEKIRFLKREISQVKNKMIQKQQIYSTIDKIIQQKAQIQEYIIDQKQLREKKKQSMSQSLKELIHKLIKSKKREIEQDCEYKVRIIRQTSNSLKKAEDLKPLLQKKSLPPKTYYTFNQLKYVPELNFRINKQSEKIMQLFYREMNPKIPQIIDHYEQPEQLIRLNQLLESIQTSKKEKKAQLIKNQLQLEAKLQEKRKVFDKVVEIKKKN